MTILFQLRLDMNIKSTGRNDFLTIWSLKPKKDQCFGGNIDLEMYLEMKRVFPKYARTVYDIRYTEIYYEYTIYQDAFIYGSYDYNYQMNKESVKIKAVSRGVGLKFVDNFSD